jgi:hypothetical protein
MKKQYIAAAVVASTLGLGGMGVGVVSAATDTKPATLVDELAQKFNLKTSDVQAVFDQHKTEMDTYRTQQITTKLDDAVSRGTITSAQKDLILKKLDELKTQREANKDKMKTMTGTERRDAMKTERDALRTWADQNKIPTDLLQSLMMGPGGRGHGGGMMGGGAPDDAPAASTN